MVSAIHCVELSWPFPTTWSLLSAVYISWLALIQDVFALPSAFSTPISPPSISYRWVSPFAPRCSYSLAGCSHKSAGLSFFLTGLLSLFPVHCDFYVHVSCGWQSFFTIFVFTSCQVCPAYTKMYWRAHCTKTEENKAKQKHKISTNTYKHT